MAKGNRKVNLDNPKIVVDDMDLKKKLGEIQEITGESIKSIIERAIQSEYAAIKRNQWMGVK